MLSPPMHPPVARNDNDGTILETKENLTSMRKAESKLNFMHGSEVYTEFEKTYGKYLFVPFDIPIILPNDTEKFVSWYFSNAKHASKDVVDFSSGLEPASDGSYLSIDSTSPGWRPIWSLNSQGSVYKQFPEIFEQIREYMPWVGDSIGFRWNMWSSSNDVIPHRDNTSCVDAPTAMRIKLFDTNPNETLSLKVDPIIEHQNDYVAIPKLTSTNSFAWNNLRTKHKSIFNGARTNRAVDGNDYRKILFIWRDILRTEKQIQQYTDLLDRSISKFAGTSNLIIDQYHATDYLNITL